MKRGESTKDLMERRNNSNSSRINDKLDPMEKSDHFEMMSQETI
jgi:hypothetical protein